MFAKLLNNVPQRRRILLMSCSQRKTPGKGLIPAIDRYDGPAHRVLRKYLRELADPGLSVYFLSGKFGVIGASRGIPNYDYKMSPQRAAWLRKRALQRIECILRSGKYNEGFFIGSRNYLRTIEPLNQFKPSFREAQGKPGQKLKSLRNWLRK
jgi:uncharacterized protein DUF6884